MLLLQFLFREFDDNRLLSWQWVMDRETLLKLLIVSAVGLSVAYKSCYVSVSKKHELLIVILGTYLFGLATWSTPEVMVDSGRYFSHAKIIATQGLGYFLSEWGHGVDAWTDLPLASVIYGVIFSIFGESRLAIQIINTFLFTGSVYVTYLLGKELWDSRTGIYAALLLLAIPFLHVQASQLLVDVPAMFFTVFAIWASIKAVTKSGSGWLLLASFAIVFAVLTKYSVWIALTSVLVLPFSKINADREYLIERLLLLGFVVLVLLVFVFYVHHPIILKQLRILLDYQIPAFQRWQESYISTFFYQTHPIVSLAALVSVYYAIKKKESVYIIPAVALFVFLLMEVYRARYFVIVFPMLALISAYGIRQIGDEFLQRFLVRGAVVMSLVFTVMVNMHFLQNYNAVNMKNAGYYLNTLDHNTAIVVALPQPATSVNPAILLPILDYYTNKSLLQFDSESVVKQLPNASGKEISPLRFTWDVQHYPYSKVGAIDPDLSAVIVLVSGRSNNKMPSDIKRLLSRYKQDRTFSITDRIFRFQSLVTVYSNSETKAGPS